MVGEALAQLTPENHATVLELLELPDVIRGYEEIKLRNVVLFRKRAETLRRRLQSRLAACVVSEVDDDLHARRRPRGPPPRLRRDAHHRRRHLGAAGGPGRRASVLRRVVELGVNLIDTADSYGPEVSENLIAEALHPYPRTS